MAIHLKSGTRLNGYTFLTDTASSDAGTSLWALAERNGHAFFIKCFLSPTYPADDAPGSPPSKARRRARCHAFEARTRAVEKALAKCGADGFVVPSVDFFRQDGTYFKVTAKIDARRVDVSALPPHKQLLLMLTAAFALRTLHARTGLVHADVKPENILLRRSGGRYLTSLIDFDAAFFQQTPPEREAMIGDQRYWPPELIDYLSRDGKPPRLSQKVDVFSLGLVFCEYLSGRLPALENGYDYAGEALLHGGALTIPPIRHEALAPAGAIVAAMLEKNPERRPTMTSVHERLRALNKKLYVKTTTLSDVGKALKRKTNGKLPVISVQPQESRQRGEAGRRVKLKGLSIESPAEPDTPPSRSRR